MASEYLSALRSSSDTIVDALARHGALRSKAGGGSGWPQNLKAQPAGDDEPLDLVRALADLQHLLVAVEA